MNNIEQNAIRITELIGLPTNVSNRTVFERFDGLMEIVEFEISDFELKAVHFELEGCGLLETVQKYVIKYLESKNEP